MAAFANTEHGGLLVIGIGTLPDAHGEVLDRLVPAQWSWHLIKA